MGRGCVGVLLVVVGALCPVRSAIGASVVVGEVLVVEGDEETLEIDDWGTPHLRADFTALLDRFYVGRADEYDSVAVFPSFFDAWTSAEHQYPPPAYEGRRLRSISRMNGRAYFATEEEAVAAVAEEFGHRWLMYELYADPATGRVTGELTGRDSAHWSSLVDTDGSFFDGVDWQDNGDGSFTVADMRVRYSAVDAYVMGLRKRADVPPFFLLRDAKLPDGTALTAMARSEGLLEVGTTVTATKVPVSVGDLVHGPAYPGPAQQRVFNVAFVLVTEPGQAAAEVEAGGQVAEIDAIRRSFESGFAAWTGAKMCTSVTDPCPLPSSAGDDGGCALGQPTSSGGPLASLLLLLSLWVLRGRAWRQSPQSRRG